MLTCLKANILIDDFGCPHLTVFHLATTALERLVMGSRSLVADTDLWMSPELMALEETGLAESRPTKQSDCYALGVVIYEVLAGKPPFAGCGNAHAVHMVLRGKLPPRPEETEGNLFTDEAWEAVEHCWKRQPCDRPSAEDVLVYLKGKESKQRRGLRELLSALGAYCIWCVPVGSLCVLLWLFWQFLELLWKLLKELGQEVELWDLMLYVMGFSVLMALVESWNNR
jgi:serine/threonine protein kinase